MFCHAAAPHTIFNKLLSAGDLTGVCSLACVTGLLYGTVALLGGLRFAKASLKQVQNGTELEAI